MLRFLAVFLLVATPAFACGPALPSGLAGWAFVGVLIALAVVSSPTFWVVVAALLVSSVVALSFTSSARARGRRFDQRREND